jgi:hypothetical protein
MYISVGVNLRNSKIPQKEGITDYGCSGWKNTFHRLQEIAHFFPEFSPENGPNPGSRKGPKIPPFSGISDKSINSQISRNLDKNSN